MIMLSKLFRIWCSKHNSHDKTQVKTLKMLSGRLPLVVQWLRLYALVVRGPGFDPWPRNQIPHVAARSSACCN